MLFPYVRSCCSSSVTSPSTTFPPTTDFVPTACCSQMPDPKFRMESQNDTKGKSSKNALPRKTQNTVLFVLFQKLVAVCLILNFFLRLPFFRHCAVSQQQAIISETLKQPVHCTTFLVPVAVNQRLPHPPSSLSYYSK